MRSLAERLPGRLVPASPLPSTSGDFVDLSTTTGRVVVFVHPGIQDPSFDPPTGWTSLPGLQGCTAQSCSYRDMHDELTSLGVTVLGLSGNEPAQQLAARERLKLSYHLLSDEGLWFVRLLGLPARRIHDRVVPSRLTLILHDGVIEHARFPVTEPDGDAHEVVRWLSDRNGLLG